MLGNPRWFRPKTLGFGLVPITWQGWGYTAAWMAGIGLPFLLLLGRHQALESMAWATLSLGALAYDVRQILRTYRSASASAKQAPAAAQPKTDDVLYILDNCPRGAAARA